MTKYLACGLCLLALYNSAQALPYSTVNVTAMDDDFDQKLCVAIYP